ncbi:MAG: multidrug effflux MFS transporter [Rhodospirillales bacterium]|nr:multidrug effflux MFS transporter [Rhodospirillales bacterium]
MPRMPEKPSLFILVALTAIGPLAVNIFLPSMPGLMQDLKTDYATVQLTLSLYLVGLAVSQLLYGPLSDRFGRRPLILIGLSIFVTGSLICAMAPTITVLITGRVIQAIGGSAGVVLGRAMVRDMYDRERSASMIAYITLSMMVAPMLAPTIGGLFDEWLGWRYSFTFVLVIGAVVAVWCLMRLAETHDATKRQLTVGTDVRFVGLLKAPAFYCYTFQLSFSSAVYFGFLGGAPFVAINLMGLTPSTFGFYYLIVSVCYMIGNFTAARISTRVGTDPMILYGTAISLVGAWMLAVFYVSDALTPLALFSSMGVVAIGNGMAIPNGVAGAISVDSRQAGAAAGISGFTQIAFGAASSTLVASLLVDSAAPLVIIMAASATIAFAIHVAGSRIVVRHRT